MSDMVVNDSLTIAVDAEPAAVLEALRVVDMVGSLTRVLRALGAGSRLALPPTILSRAGSDALRLGVVWRVIDGDAVRVVGADAFDAFHRPGHVKASWELSVTATGYAGTHLSIGTSLLATEPDAYARLLDAWPALGPLSRGLAQRAARGIRSRAEDEGWQLAA
jgi:hypothetical protein